MNTAMKHIDLNTIELVPLTEFDNEASNYAAGVLAKRAIVAPKVGNISAKKTAVVERDSAFQRMMSSVTGLFKPTPVKKGKDDVLPNVAPCSETPTALPANHPAIVIRGKQQLRTLYHLLHATASDGIPIAKLQHLVGSGNQWDTVARLNRNVGKQIVQATEYLVVNKTGKATRRANYWLTEEGKRLAPMILASSEYVHDEKPDGYHLHRPGMEAAEFLATSSINGDDLLVLRDGTMPQWLRLFYLLRAANGKWVPRYVADELLDSCNVRQVVRVANAKVGGGAIESTTRTMPNRDGGVCEYGLYRIADGWADKVDKVIKEKLVSARKVAK